MSEQTPSDLPPNFGKDDLSGSLRDYQMERIVELERELSVALRRVGELEKLARFGAVLLEEHRQNLGDIDGGWMQDKAEEMKLLERVEVQKACNDGEFEVCSCAEWGDFPKECLRYTKETREAIDAAIAGEAQP